MKPLSAPFIIIGLVSLTGCSNLPLERDRVVEPEPAITVITEPPCCCDAPSGYYYNGYKENGWRYCVVKVKN